MMTRLHFLAGCVQYGDFADAFLRPPAPSIHHRLLGDRTQPDALAQEGAARYPHGYIQGDSLSSEEKGILLER